MTTLHANNEEFSTMTNEELQAHMEAIQAELGRRKWANVDEVMTRIEALTDEELAELSGRVSSLKIARDRKVREMTQQQHGDDEHADVIEGMKALWKQEPKPWQKQEKMNTNPYEGMSAEEVIKLLGGVS